MKELAIFLICLFHLLPVNAQEISAEADIRKLEEQERQAVLKKDTAMLRKIWDKHFLVNAPNNKISISGADAVARPVITGMSYASFTREIEQILVRGDVVFSMGSEIVVPAEGSANAGEEVKRRYTNIWMKQNNIWTLVARHASVICQ